MAGGEVVEVAGMRSFLRASLGAERGPSMLVIFLFMWLRPHASGEVLEEGGMRSPLRASLGAERGPSMLVIFEFMWLRSHGGW